MEILQWVKKILANTSNLFLFLFSSPIRSVSTSSGNSQNAATACYVVKLFRGGFGHVLHWSTNSSPRLKDSADPSQRTSCLGHFSDLDTTRSELVWCCVLAAFRRFGHCRPAFQGREGFVCGFHTVFLCNNVSDPIFWLLASPVYMKRMKRTRAYLNTTAFLKSQQ